MRSAKVYCLEAGATLPTGRRGISSGKSDYSLNAIYSADIGSYHTDLNLVSGRLRAQHAFGCAGSILLHRTHGTRPASLLIRQGANGKRTRFRIGTLPMRGIPDGAYGSDAVRTHQGQGPNDHAGGADDSGTVHAAQPGVQAHDDEEHCRHEDPVARHARPWSARPPTIGKERERFLRSPLNWRWG